MTRHRIPVRVGTTPVSTRTVYPEAPVVPGQVQKESPPHAAPPHAALHAAQDSHLGIDQQPEIVKADGAAPDTEVSTLASSVSKDREGSQIPWRDRALRLQAEMDNYRRRQRRIAQEEAQADQERLLRDMLRVADNLDRTLAAGQRGVSASGVPQRSSGPGTSNGLRQGVELTRDDLLRILANYGVERFEALGASFDPAWHEAVQVVSAQALGVEPGTVVEQLQSGYRRHDAVHGERLFRPAQVVVAN